MTAVATSESLGVPIGTAALSVAKMKSHSDVTLLFARLGLSLSRGLPPGHLLLLRAVYKKLYQKNQSWLEREERGPNRRWPFFSLYSALDLRWLFDRQ